MMDGKRLSRKNRANLPTRMDLQKVLGLPQLNFDQNFASNSAKKLSIFSNWSILYRKLNKYEINVSYILWSVIDLPVNVLKGVFFKFSILLGSR